MENRYSYDLAFSKEDWVQDSIDDIILELIKQRKKKHITQLELSEKISVPQSTISRIETFRTIPTLPMLLRLGKALELKLELHPQESEVKS